MNTQNRQLLDQMYHYDCASGRLVPRDFPNARPEIVEIFSELVRAAVKYKKLTGRHLPILGELGEVFAEMAFGIKRHGPMTQGSDGMLGNEFVEIKTITPDKRSGKVWVKHTGNFGRLVVVKITADFQFAARMVGRGMLKKGTGKFSTLLWDEMIINEKDPEIHGVFPMKRVK